MDVAREARGLLRSRDFGVLSTLSLEMGGHPFGSIAPYVLDDDGCPILLIAAIAQHTKNIMADPRVSLTVWEDGLKDPQSGARLTWLGDAKRVPDADSAAAARYARYLPSSIEHFKAHDFALYRIGMTRARFIGGFGSIHWIEPQGMRAANPIASSEQRILAHMNDDHKDSVLAYCRKLKGLQVHQAVMVGVDPEGFDVLADGKRVRFSFESPVSTTNEVRTQMVELANKAKSH